MPLLNQPFCIIFLLHSLVDGESVRVPSTKLSNLTLLANLRLSYSSVCKKRAVAVEFPRPAVFVVGHQTVVFNVIIHGCKFSDPSPILPLLVYI